MDQTADHVTPDTLSETTKVSRKGRQRKDVRGDQRKPPSKRSSKAQRTVLADGDTREDRGVARSYDGGDRLVDYPQSLGRILQHVLEPLCQRKPHMRMMMDWPLIVGQELARWTWPVKVHQARQGPGVLYVQVAAAHYFQAWSQSSMYVDRVNQYMGYGAVHRVHFSRVDVMNERRDGDTDTGCS